jgi:hypothetical protein
LRADSQLLNCSSRCFGVADWNGPGEKLKQELSCGRKEETRPNPKFATSSAATVALFVGRVLYIYGAGKALGGGSVRRDELNTFLFGESLPLCRRGGVYVRGEKLDLLLFNTNTA